MAKFVEKLNWVSKTVFFFSKLNRINDQVILERLTFNLVHARDGRVTITNNSDRHFYEDISLTQGCRAVPSPKMFPSSWMNTLPVFQGASLQEQLLHEPNSNEGYNVRLIDD